MDPLCAVGSPIWTSFSQLFLLIPLMFPLGGSFLYAMESKEDGKTAFYIEPSSPSLRERLHLYWVLIVCLAPAALCVLAFAPDLWTSDPVLVLVLTMICLWLLFPICLLSTLKEESWLVVFSTEVLRRLIQLRSSVLDFYVITLVLITACIGSWALTFGDYPLFLPVAAFLWPAGFLIYARLLGGLRWMIIDLERESGLHPSHSSEGIGGSLVSPIEMDESSQSQRAIEVSLTQGQDSANWTQPSTREPEWTKAEQIFRPIQVRLEMERERLRPTMFRCPHWQGSWTYPFEGGFVFWILLSMISLFLGLAFVLLRWQIG